MTKRSAYKNNFTENEFLLVSYLELSSTKIIIFELYTNNFSQKSAKRKDSSIMNFPLKNYPNFSSG